MGSLEIYIICLWGLWNNDITDVLLCLVEETWFMWHRHSLLHLCSDNSEEDMSAETSSLSSGRINPRQEPTANS